MNIDELLATAQPRTDTVRICARGDLVAAHEEASRALDAATRKDDSLSGSPEVTAAAERVTAIEAEQEAATVTFELRAISRKEWADLLRRHPPSKEDQRLGRDSDDFVAASVAACVTSPEMTFEQAKQLAAVIQVGEWNKLYMATLNLNTTATPHPKLAAATELLRANGQSSTTSAPAASLEDGSLAGSGEQ